MEHYSNNYSINIHHIDDLSNIYKCDTLKELSILCPIRKEQEIIDLASFLKLNNSLNILKLDGCELEDSGIKLILEALRENKQIKHLCLSENILDIEGANLIADFLELNETLEILDISDDFRQSKNEQGVKNILNAINKNKHLKKLCIRSIYIGESEEFIELIRNNTLNELNITKCKISDNILERFFDELTFNKSLNSLNAIHCVNISKIMEKVTNCLIGNQSLKSLILGFNNIGDTEIKILSESLKINQTLDKLNIQNNKITDEGIIYLIEALKINKSINLDGNRLTDKGVNYILEMFEWNKNIIDLILEKNSISEEKLEEINKLCKHNNNV